MLARCLALGWAGLALAGPVGTRASAASFEALFSPELRQGETSLNALEAELATLPAEPPDQSASRLGWHGRFGGAPQGKSAVVDLGRTQPFDAVVLVPANAPSGRHSGAGYGFPPRFRVEVLSGEPGSLPVTLADLTQADFPPPGGLPVVLETPGAEGRLVRVTATRSYRTEVGSVFALAEIMVLSGERNLAAAAPVRTDDDYLNAPAWQPENLTDGQSPLGPPLMPQAAPRYGYHAALAEHESETKWCQLDLGRMQSLDEVRLHSARPVDFPPRRGFGFPLHFRVEASLTADFRDARLLLGCEDEDFLNPGENPVVIPAGGVAARYVRMTATKLWPRDRFFAFALGEMEVYAGGVNIAHAATAQALDSEEISRWTLPALNDGFTSQGKLVPQAAWLRGLSRRREILAELPALAATRARLQHDVRARLLAGAGLLAAVAAAALGWAVVRRRHRHRQELSHLRRRIAADLHDEVGSNLGSIALLTQMAAEHAPGEARHDIAEIRRLAQESAEAMRDLVWLIQPGRRQPAELPARMREVTAPLLAGVEWTFEVKDVRRPFHLEAERQIFLFYKEALHNVRKHARATRVVVTAGQEGREFRLTVRDDGLGFDPALVTAGHGLASLRHRAESLGGRFILDTRPGHGTTIGLHAPLT